MAERKRERDFYHPRSDSHGALPFSRQREVDEAPHVDDAEVGRGMFRRLTILCVASVRFSRGGDFEALLPFSRDVFKSSPQAI